MKLSKLFAFLLALLFIGIGIVLSMFFLNAKEQFGRSATSYEVQFQKLNEPELKEVLDTAHLVLTQKDATAQDSYDQLGKIKDSLFKIDGALETNITLQRKKKVKTQADNDTLNQLIAADENIKALIAATNKIIMNKTLEDLKPTNTALRKLLKDMQEQTTKLQNIGAAIGTISDIVASLTAILSTPIFGAVSSVPQ